MPRGLAVGLARIRVPALIAVIVLLIASPYVFGMPWWLALAIFLVAFVVFSWAGGVGDAPVRVAVPVRGRWAAVNSPADRVPSHGTHGYGQTYAIDLVHEPQDQPRPRFGWSPLTRRPEDFPAFGEPVLAAAPGTVVRARGGQRDHRSRNSWPALAYLTVEGMVREVLGVSRIVGNHVVIDHGDGVYSLYAHLKRGSLTVEPGQRVEVGETIAQCGNSGNSSEPHVHFQLMDHRHPMVAAGLPFEFAAFTTDGAEVANGVPRAGKPFTTSTVDA